MPTSLITISSTLNLCTVLTLDPLNSTSKHNVLYAKDEISSSLLSGNSSKYLNKILTSHINPHLALGGLRLKTPFINFLMRGWSPIDEKGGKHISLERADLADFMTL